MFKTLALFLLLSSGVARADGAKVSPPAAKIDKKPMTETAQDKNKALVRRFYDEVWNKGHLDVADEVFARDYVRHDPGPPAPPGAEGQKQVAAGMRKAFPDLVYTVDFMIAENDIVAARWTIQGTQTGDMMGAKPTGKKVTFSGVNIFRFDHGKVAELWNHRDDLSMMVQLGMVQLPKPAKP
ncbi:MAG TPA: ester cyclase [Kofleriaceae bacterium]|nr:ester cyclase [Kofleriaceae bacterium]